MALHDAAIKDEFFVKRKLAPNVDFWYVPVKGLTFCFRALIESTFDFVGGEWLVEFWPLGTALNSG